MLNQTQRIEKMIGLDFNKFGLIKKMCLKTFENQVKSSFIIFI